MRRGDVFPRDLETSDMVRDMNVYYSVSSCRRGGCREVNQTRVTGIAAEGIVGWRTYE